MPLARFSSALLVAFACSGATTQQQPPPPPQPPPGVVEAPPAAVDAGAPPVDAAVVTAPAPEPEPEECPPRDRTTHCIVLALREPTAERAAAVAQRMVADGLAAAASGEQVELQMSDDDVRRIFGGRVVYRMTGASASDRMTCQASIDRGRVPARYRRDVTALAVGHQLCE